MFMTEDEYKKRMDEYYRRLKKLPRAEGFDEILMPGEPEERKTRNALTNGITMTRQIMDSLYLEAKKRGVSCPEVFGEKAWEHVEDSGAVVFQKQKQPSGVIEGRAR